VSQKPLIIVSRKLPEAVEARLVRDYRARLNTEDRLYATDELIALLEGADALLACHTERMDAATIERLPQSVRVIANVSVGVDHVDLAAAKRRGIAVTNTPDVLSDATAEIALLLMLGAARRAGEGERLVRANAWKSWSPTFMLGTQVTGKRLGFIGMGRVGRAFARMTCGLGMHLHYHNRRRLSDEQAVGAVYHETVEDLLPHCDFLSLHCPATPETADLLNAARIALMPDGAIVVNTARGAVIDEDALIAALRTGKLAAAGLDVFKNEPDIHPEFRRLDTVFVLPHIGSATRETRDAMGFRALDNLDAVFAGREPGDRVA